MIGARPPAPCPATFLGFYWARPGLQKYWTKAEQIDSDNGRLLAWLLSRKTRGEGEGRGGGQQVASAGARGAGGLLGSPGRGGSGAASPGLCPRSRRRPAGGPAREPRVRELRLHPDAALAAGRHRPLLVQRLRALQQDERPQPAPHQAAEARGECERRPPLRPGPGAALLLWPRRCRLAPGAPAGTGAARPGAAGVCPSAGTQLSPSHLRAPGGRLSRNQRLGNEDSLSPHLHLGHGVCKWGEEKGVGSYHFLNTRKSILTYL